MPTIPEKTITQNIMNGLQEISAGDNEGVPMTGQDLITWFWKKTAELWAPQLKLHRKRNVGDSEFNINET